MSRILRGDPDGWDVMHDYLEYQHWGTLMFEEIYQRDTRPDPHRLRLTIRAFSEVLLALHLGRRPAADATLLRLSREAREKECRHWKHSTGALAFQVRLYELWTGRDADFDMGKLPPLGEYEQLLDPTCVGERYRASLAWACAEHIAQTVDTKKRCPPFNIGLFRTLPMEIVLWQRYRERLGLDAETDQHPLLESPLALRTPPPRSAPPSALRTLLNRAIPHMDAYLRESA
ncbi:MAG TPA: hypothetical protein VNN80_29660 [Polyangiaceae bacterium]|nr:hypothetical protein [Polyangiaceae bacterium]